jgi:hypothetical protein
VDLETPNLIYLGTPALEDGRHGTVYKTIDGGATWQDTGGSRSWLGIRSMAIDPQDSSTVYAGTECGVFKTIDGGASWAASGPAGATEIAGIVIDAHNTSII